MAPFPTITVQPQPHIEARQISIPSPLYALTNPSSPIIATHRHVPRSDNSNGPSTGVVIAAVLSSILGTLVLLTVLYKCCVDNRSAAYIPRAHTSYDISSDDECTGVRTRGGGLPDHHHPYHHRVKRPDRARTRCRNGSGVRSLSYSSRSRYRSRRRIGKHDGLLGWAFVPRRTVYRSSYGGGYGYDRRWPDERRNEILLDD